MCFIMGRSLFTGSMDWVISFPFSPIAFELTPNTQIWPRNLNTDIGGTTVDGLYLIVINISGIHSRKSI